MKIAAAQTKPVKGDIFQNILQHKKIIVAAAGNGAELIVFPELSLTGYEPALAGELAVSSDKAWIEELQELSNEYHLIIATGVPAKDDDGVYISMTIYQPHEPGRLYSKKYLHADEEPFFKSGKNFPVLQVSGQKIAFAICYELSVPAHAQQAIANGANVYLASVAKTAGGMDNAAEILAALAKNNGIPVMISNCIGYCDNFEAVGRSCVWNSKGEVAEVLGAEDIGFIVFDTATGEHDRVLLAE